MAKKPAKSVIEVEGKGITGAKENTGRVKVLMAIGYKDGMVYGRRVDEDLFFWDAVWENKLYSNYMVITGKKSKQILTEISSMLYAGAAATIDMLRGDEVTDEEKKIVEMMESKREEIEGKTNGS